MEHLTKLFPNTKPRGAWYNEKVGFATSSEPKTSSFGCNGGLRHLGSLDPPQSPVDPFKELLKQQRIALVKLCGLSTAPARRGTRKKPADATIMTA